MTLFATIRHGPTEWNAVGRVQGRSDIPLSAAGRDTVAAWRVPPELAGFDWIASPLKRTAETAEALTGGPVARDDRLVEMDWAEWEGNTLAALRAELGDLMVAWESRGLDFHAPGGESPRDVQRRVAPLLAEIAARDTPVAAVTHRGVIRAIYALASGWDMTGKPPEKLREETAHIFLLSPGGVPLVHRVNIPLMAEERPE
jgi:probable phosphoglycerate mutase